MQIAINSEPGPRASEHIKKHTVESKTNTILFHSYVEFKKQNKQRKGTKNKLLKTENRVTQRVERVTLDFDSGQDLRVLTSGSTLSREWA